MGTVKQQAAQLLDGLPDTATWDDLIDRLTRLRDTSNQQTPHVANQVEQAKTSEVSSQDLFTERWRGKFRFADRDEKRFQTLVKRYQ
ncbi:MAG: hypothetical protein AAF560_07680 [Acidobacteriota bacterium]